jgi:hypothetical protein
MRMPPAIESATATSVARGGGLPLAVARESHTLCVLE